VNRVFQINLPALIRNQPIMSTVIKW